MMFVANLNIYMYVWCGFSGGWVHHSFLCRHEHLYDVAWGGGVGGLPPRFLLQAWTFIWCSLRGVWGVSPHDFYCRLEHLYDVAWGGGVGGLPPQFLLMAWTFIWCGLRGGWGVSPHDFYCSLEHLYDVAWGGGIQVFITPFEMRRQVKKNV